VYGAPGNLDSLIGLSPLGIFFPSMEEKEQLTGTINCVLCTLDGRLDCIQQLNYG
jgi:hypothetical protein